MLDEGDCHAGHYISRGVYSTRWDEENVNCQCAGCNLKQSLADVETIHTYERELKRKYGENIFTHKDVTKKQKYIENGKERIQSKTYRIWYSYGLYPVNYTQHHENLLS